MNLKVFSLGSVDDSTLNEFKVFEPALVDETDTLGEVQDVTGQFGPLGIMSKPCAPNSDGAVECLIGETNDFHVVGMTDKRLVSKYANLQEGDLLLFTVKSTGGSKVLLAQSGVVSVNGGADFVALAAKTKTALDYITALKNACKAAFTAINAVAPNTGAAGVDAALVGFDSNVASTALKTD